MSKTMDFVVSLILTCVFACLSYTLDGTSLANASYFHCLALGSAVYMNQVLYHKGKAPFTLAIFNRWFLLMVCMLVAVYVAMPIALELEAASVYLDLFRLICVLIGAGAYRLLHE